MKANVLSGWLRRASVVAIDADDTLWYDAKYFGRVRDSLIAIAASRGVSKSKVLAKLAEYERNAQPGEQGWAGAIRETVAGLNLSGEMSEIDRALSEFRSHPVELLPGVREALAAMGGRQKWVITKGNLAEQTDKLERSGVKDSFDRVLVVKRKDSIGFTNILLEEGVQASCVLMIGNSIKHDIVPACSNGAMAVWMNHEFNVHGDNAELPREALEVRSWTEIAASC